MFNKTNSKIFFYISCGLTLYFGFLFLDAYVIHSKFVLIGVFRELFTIPALFIQLLMLGVTFNNWRREKFQLKSYSFWSFLMLIITSAVMLLAMAFER